MLENGFLATSLLKHESCYLKQTLTPATIYALVTGLTVLCIFRVTVCLTRMVSRSSIFHFPLAPPPFFLWSISPSVYTKFLVPDWHTSGLSCRDFANTGIFPVSQTTWGSRDGADDYDAERMKKRTDSDRPKSPYYPKFITQ